MRALPHMPCWLEMLLLATISVMAAYVVNAARPEPLGWTEDYTAAKVKSVARKGLAVLDLAGARQAWKNGQRLFVDARDPEEFADGHIPGAVNLPEEALMSGASVLPGVPKNRPLAIYCVNLACPKSQDLAQALKQMGYEDLAVFPAGFEAWKGAGLALEPAK